MLFRWLMEVIQLVVTVWPGDKGVVHMANPAMEFLLGGEPKVTFLKSSV
jgi:hypothetical protein